MPRPSTSGYVAVVFVLGCMAAGCTQQQLQLNTSLLAQTIPDLQEDQVLDNLVTFSQSDHSAIPGFVSLGAGSAQIVQTIQPSLNFTLPLTARTGALSTSNQTTNGWTLVPIVDPTELKRLQTLFLALFIDDFAKTSKKYIAIKGAFDDMFKNKDKLDADNKPILAWEPVTFGNGQVAVNPFTGKAFFKAIYRKPSGEKFTLEKFPRKWFSIDKGSDGDRFAGIHRGHSVYIKQGEEDNFWQFVILTMGDSKTKQASDKLMIFTSPLIPTVGN